MSAHTEALKQARQALRIHQGALMEFGRCMAPECKQTQVEWEEADMRCCEAAINAIDAALSLPDPGAAPVVLQGWRMVPVEPTNAMWDAAVAEQNRVEALAPTQHPSCFQTYKVMLAAAPPAPHQADGAQQ